MASLDAAIAATQAFADDAVAAMARIQAAIDALHGTEVRIGVDASAASAAAAAAATRQMETAAAGGAAALRDMESAAAGAAAALAAEAAAEDAAAAAVNTVTDAIGQQARDMALLTAAENVLNGEQMQLLSDTDFLTAAVLANTDALKAQGDAAALSAAKAGGAFRAFGVNWGANLGIAGGLLTVTAWHLAADAAIEFAAVAVPAMVAVGAAAAAAAPAVQDIRTHMQAVGTVSDATGQSLTRVQATFSAISQAVAPGVLEIYGSALNLVTGRMGAFGQIAQGAIAVLDRFAADINNWASAGGGSFINALVAHAVPDMTMFGQVIGNVGIVMGNLLRAMPGFAEAFLSIAVGASRLLAVITSLPTPLLEAGIALHGLLVYGSTLANAFSKLLIPMAALSSHIPIGPIRQWGTAVKTAAAEAEKGRTGVAAFGAAFGGISDALIGGGVIAAGLIGIITLLRRGAVSADSLGSAMRQALAVANFSTGVAELTSNISLLTQWQHRATQEAANYQQRANSTVGTNALFAESMHSAGQQAQYQASQFAATRGQMQGYLSNTQHLMNWMTHTFGMSYPAALKAADMANIGVTSSFGEMQQQMKNLVAGYGGMRAVAGMLGSDVQAVTFATELQNSKVQQLNTSWDTFIATVQAPTTTFLAFAQAIAQYGHDATNAGAAMTGLGGSSVTATRNFNTAAIQMRQDFANAVSAAQPFLDTLRTTALVTGNGGPLVKGIKDAAAALLPLAGHSTQARDQIYALLQEAGYKGPDTFRAMATAIGTVKSPLNALDTLAGQSAKQLSNLGRDAQNLAQVISGTLNQMLVQQANNVAGVNTKLHTYLSDLNQYGPASHKTAAALQAYNQAQNQANYLATAGAAHTAALTGKVAAQGGAYYHSAGAARAAAFADLAKMQADLRQAASAQTATQRILEERQAALELKAAIDALQSKTITVTVVQQMISRVQTNYVGPGALGHNVGAHGGIVTATGIHAAAGAVLPGFMPGHDIIPAWLSPGEAVLNPYATRMLGPGFIHMLNTAAERGGGVNPAALQTQGGGGGFGFGGGMPVIENHLYLDGQEIFANHKVHTLRYNTRNSGARTGAVVPGMSPQV